MFESLISLKLAAVGTTTISIRIFFVISTCVVFLRGGFEREPSELHRGGLELLEPPKLEGSWNTLDLEPSGTLWAPVDKEKMPDFYQIKVCF